MLVPDAALNSMIRQPEISGYATADPSDPLWSQSCATPFRAGGSLGLVSGGAAPRLHGKLVKLRRFECGGGAFLPCRMPPLCHEPSSRITCARTTGSKLRLAKQFRKAAPHSKLISASGNCRKSRASEEAPLGGIDYAQKRHAYQPQMAPAELIIASSLADKRV